MTPTLTTARPSSSPVSAMPPATSYATGMNDGKERLRANSSPCNNSVTPLWQKTSQLIAWLSFKSGWKPNWNKDLAFKRNLKNCVKERNLIAKSSSGSVLYQNYSSLSLVLALVNFIWALSSLQTADGHQLPHSAGLHGGEIIWWISESWTAPA